MKELNHSEMADSEFFGQKYDSAKLLGPHDIPFFEINSATHEIINGGVILFKKYRQLDNLSQQCDIGGTLFGC